MDDLTSLMERIKTTWVCDASRYPELAGKSWEGRRNFLMKHSLMHIGKTTGKIASVCEEFDHNGTSGPQDQERLKEHATKLFVNALKFAEESGLTADELLKRAPQYVT